MKIQKWNNKTGIILDPTIELESAISVFLDRQGNIDMITSALSDAAAAGARVYTVADGRNVDHDSQNEIGIRNFAVNPDAMVWYCYTSSGQIVNPTYKEHKLSIDFKDLLESAADKHVKTLLINPSQTACISLSDETTTNKKNWNDLKCILDFANKKLDLAFQALKDDLDFSRTVIVLTKTEHNSYEQLQMDFSDAVRAGENPEELIILSKSYNICYYLDESDKTTICNWLQDKTESETDESPFSSDISIL